MVTEMLTPVRGVLIANTTLYALVADRVYAHVENPPIGYKVADGPCICFKLRGGTPGESDRLLQPSIQFKCIGKDELEAVQVWQALYDALDGYQGAIVRNAYCEVYGQTVYEPATKWVTNLSFFRAEIANT